MPLARQYKAGRVFQTKRPTYMWDTDTMDGQGKYLDGNRYAQVFSNWTYFTEIYQMSKKAEAGQALNMFVMEIGVPEELTVDGSKEQNSPGTEFMKCYQRNEILLIRTEPEIPNQNTEEGVIREV